MIEHALEHALGNAWPVFPLAGKVPRTARGFKDATVNEEQIKKWWALWPDAGIGISTGKPSGLFIVDIDPRNGGDETIAALQVEHGKLPLTRMVRTGGDGLHIYLRLPDGEREWVKQLGPGVDVKADGGYVVGPPSLHPSGKPYRWVDENAPILDAPAWLVGLATKPVPIPRPLSPMASSDPLPAYAEVALRGEVERVKIAQEGSRNHVLNRAAFSLGQLVGAGQLDRSTVESSLFNAAITVGLGEREIEKTLRSGLNDGEKEPRMVRPREPRHRHSRSLASGESEDDGDVDRFHLSDLGNAERLVAAHGIDLRYVRLWKKWLVWDGKRWAPDDTDEIMRRASTVAAMVDEEARNELDDNTRKSLRTWANKSESSYAHQQLVRLAESRIEVAARPSDFDRDPMLLNVQNGTIDLRTGKLAPHSREDNLTKLAPVIFDETATCPRWNQFLGEIFDSEDLRSFVQRTVGYCLTGDVGEHAFFIFHGTGANGKSVFVETLNAILGDYFVGARSETLLCKKDHDGGRASPDIARLKGARFVAANETPNGAKLDEALVKELCGGDTLTARHLYGEPFDFRPQLKIALRTNYKPRISGGDEGIWRRIKLTPFSKTIPLELRDPNLQVKLRSELPGVLAWGVRGCLEWQAKGLGTCEPVIAATAAYRSDQDSLGRFLGECVAMKDEAWVATTALRATYETWCRSSSEEALSQKALATALSGRGLVARSKKLDGKPTRGWEGLSLIRDTDGYTSSSNFPRSSLIEKSDEEPYPSVTQMAKACSVRRAFFCKFR